MPCNASPDAPLLRPSCRVLLLVVALGAAPIALGLGLPFMLTDSPPSADTLWAREVQGAVAPPAPEAPAAPVAAERRPG